MDPIKFSEIVKRMKEKINEGSKPSIYFDSIPDELIQDSKKEIKHNPVIHRLLQAKSQGKFLVVFKSRRVGMSYIKDFESLILKSRKRPNTKPSFIVDDWDNFDHSYKSNLAEALFSYQTYLRAL